MNDQPKEKSEFLADLLQHPGWPEIVALIAREAHLARDEGKKVLAERTIDAVALRAINVEATMDTLRAIVFAVYEKAGAARPESITELLR